MYPPPQKSRLSTFPDGRFQCAPRVRTIGIKWLSGFIMMGPARAEFYRAPRKLDLCCDLSWRVSFFQRVVRLFESDFRRGFDGV